MEECGEGEEKKWPYKIQGAAEEQEEREHGNKKKGGGVLPLTGVFSL